MKSETFLLFSVHSKFVENMQYYNNRNGCHYIIGKIQVEPNENYYCDEEICNCLKGEGSGPSYYTTLEESIKQFQQYAGWKRWDHQVDGWIDGEI